MITETFRNKKIKPTPKVSLKQSEPPHPSEPLAMVPKAHFLLNIIAVYYVVPSRIQQLFLKEELKIEPSPG